jgi:hypothetical protein
MKLTGQCLCGATRWEAAGPPTAVHNCHCSMCRRWTGAAFASLVWFPRDAVKWIQGNPTVFRSSPIAVRGHCTACGTPLYLDYDGKPELALSLGSVDDQRSVRPAYHYGIESKLPWVEVGDLPVKETREHW